MAGKHRRRIPLSLLALALIFPIMSMAPATVTPADAAATSFDFEGGGWGHAVGLSQYGAYGRALLDGADAENILTHYYTGSNLKNLGGGVPTPGPLWVNLEHRITTAELHIDTTEGIGAGASLAHEGATFPAAVGDAIEINVIALNDGAPVCRFSIAGALSEGPCFATIAWDGMAAAPSTRVTIHETRSAANDPAAPCTNVDWNAVPTTYRPCSYGHGTMHIRPADGDRFHIVLELDIEDYVSGISEMPYYWGNPADGPNGQAALEAQAIAARSYALSRQIARGNPDDRSCWCSVVDTAADQRYVGWGHVGLGSDAWQRAVDDTAGRVLTHPSIGGGNRPLAAYYGSSTYGRTESALHGFAQDVAYLQSVDDHWAVDPAVRNPYATWSKTLSGTELAHRLGLSGRNIVDVAASACADSGAAAQLRFVDEAGDEHLRSTRSLRSILGIRSSQIVAINGSPVCGTPRQDPGEPAPEPPPDDGGSGIAADLAATANVRVRDSGGDASGNGNGRPECGETIELLTRIRNLGTTTATGVAATVRIDDPYLEVLYNTTSTFPDIAPGAHKAGNDDWDVRIADVTPRGHLGRVELDVTAADGSTTSLEFILKVRCDGAPAEQPIVLKKVTIDDGVHGDSDGNNDARAQCGETIELYVRLKNTTDEKIKGVSAELISDDPYTTILYNTTSDYPNIRPDKARENQNDWDIEIAPDAPRDHTMELTLRVQADGVQVDVPVVIPVGCGGGTALAGVVRIDDDAAGDSVGNGDGRAQCGETIELTMPLTNNGYQPTTGITATLTTNDPALTLLHNATSPYPDLAPGDTAVNSNDWDLRIGSVADGAVARYTITVVADGLEYTERNTLTIECGDPSPVTVSNTTVDDGIYGDSIGNNDKIAQCGELIELYVELSNSSPDDIGGFTAALATDDPYVTILYNERSPYPGLGAGAAAENLDDWDIQIASSVPDRHTASFTLTIDALDAVVDVPLTLRCTR